MRRLLLAFILVGMIMTISRSNAITGGITVVAVLGLFALVKYKRKEFVKVYASVEELTEAFRGDHDAFADYVEKSFAKNDYIVQLPPDDIETDVAMRVWKDGHEALVITEFLEEGQEIARSVMLGLHIDLIECDVEGGIIVTNGTYTREQDYDAHKYGIRLIDGHELLKMNETPEKEQ